MPNKLDMFNEHRLLSVLYWQNEFIDDVRINDSLFSSSSSRNVYKAMCYLKQQAIPFSRDALLNQYSQYDIDASSAVIDITVKPQAEKILDIKDIITHLIDANKRRRAISNLKKAVKKIEDVTVLNLENKTEIDDFISEAENALVLETHNVNKVMNFSEWSADYGRELHERKK